MKITERHLFNYIFYPDTLEQEEYNYIKINENKFKTELDILRATKNAQDENVSDETINKIRQKIKALENLKVIKLYKDDSKQEEKELLVLAAESPTLERVIQSDTFRDKDSHYLVKVITEKDQNKIFIFSEDNSELKDFKVLLEPSGESIDVESSAKPLLVKPKQVIERISLLNNT